MKKSYLKILSKLRKTLIFTSRPACILSNLYNNEKTVGSSYSVG